MKTGRARGREKVLARFITREPEEVKFFEVAFFTHCRVERFLMGTEDVDETTATKPDPGKDFAKNVGGLTWRSGGVDYSATC